MILCDLGEGKFLNKKNLPLCRIIMVHCRRYSTKRTGKDGKSRYEEDEL